MNYDNEEFFSIDFLKAVAAILITNSHMSNIYPYSFLALGGAHGNALFFIVSGYLLAKFENISLIDFLKKRVKRLIIPILLVFIAWGAMQALMGITYSNVLYVIYSFANTYWFLAAYILYLPIYYWIVKKGDIYNIIFAIVTWVVTYFFVYVVIMDKSEFFVELSGLAPFKVLFYLGIFILGGLIRKSSVISKRLANVLSISILLSFAIWVVEYYLISVKHCAYMYQFVIHFAICIFAVSSALIFLKCEEWNIKDIVWSDAMQRMCHSIATSTLEIYVIQITFRFLCEKAGWPYGWLMFWIIAIFGGIMFHKVVLKIERVIYERDK